MARRVAKGQRRVDILEAGARAMAGGGYHGMSMRDLARATGLGLASFYNYFRSKEELLYAIQTEAFDALIASAQRAVASASEPADRFYAFLLNHLRYFSEHPDVMRVLVHEAGALPRARRSQVRARKETYFQLGLSLVREVVSDGCGVAPGAEGPADEAELERVTYSVFGMLNWTYGWYEAERHGSPAEVARTIHRIALCGVVARCPQRAGLRRVERKLLATEVTPLLGQGEEAT